MVFYLTDQYGFPWLITADNGGSEIKTQPSPVGGGAQSASTINDTGNTTSWQIGIELDGDNIPQVTITQITYSSAYPQQRLFSSDGVFAYIFLVTNDGLGDYELTVTTASLGGTQGLIGGKNYTRYTTAVQGQDQINVPTLCSLQINNVDAAFQIPLQGQYVQIYSNKYQKYYFTGYITSNPELTPLGVGNVPGYILFKYMVKCTSEEYLLNNKAVPYMPPFVGLTQGQIIVQLAQNLAPGLEIDLTSHVASGDIVPYYAYDPSQSWSQLLQKFAGQSLYRYKVLNHVLYFEPY